MNDVKVSSIIFSNDRPLVLIAGPCVIESRDMTWRIAESLVKITTDLGMPLVFKASYDKANRTSVDSFRGPGLEKGLTILAEIKKQFNIPILTDVHSPKEAELASAVADIIQIPAFLMRQTDLVVSAARTQNVINVKKAQFVSSEEMTYVIQKMESVNNKNILLTERGTFFGYHNLVVDYRNLDIMKKTGYPVIFDATHSVQRPGAGDGKTIGNREFIPLLAKAAVSAGISGVFMEVHPDPDKGLSDAANMFPLNRLKSLLKLLMEIDRIVKNEEE